MPSIHPLLLQLGEAGSTTGSARHTSQPHHFNTALKRKTGRHSPMTPLPPLANRISLVPQLRHVCQRDPAGRHSGRW